MYQHNALTASRNTFMLSVYTVASVLLNVVLIGYVIFDKLF
jgi:hypothetical protein